MTEPVQNLAPSVNHFVEGDVLGLCQSLQQCAVFVVKSQVHGHDYMVPKWYYAGSRQHSPVVHMGAGHPTSSTQRQTQALGAQPMRSASETMIPSGPRT